VSFLDTLYDILGGLFSCYQLLLMLVLIYFIAFLNTLALKTGSMHFNLYAVWSVLCIPRGRNTFTFCCIYYYYYNYCCKLVWNIAKMSKQCIMPVNMCICSGLYQMVALTLTLDGCAVHKYTALSACYTWRIYAVAQPGSDLGEGTTIEHFTFSSAGTCCPFDVVSIVTQWSRWIWRFRGSGSGDRSPLVWSRGTAPVEVWGKAPRSWW